MTDEQRTLYDIPADNWDKFEKQMKALNRRAEKIGSSIMWMVFSHEDRDVGGIKTRVFNVMISADKEVKIDGWRFVARLDHSNETGNIVRMVPNSGVIVPETYRTCPPNCDHCKIARRRRDTFVLWNETTGEFKQVGSTCLEGFFGFDPMKIARLAELLGYAHECATGMGEYGISDRRWLPVEEYLENVAAIIRKHGWVSGKTAYETGRVATRTVALDNMLRPYDPLYAHVPVEDDDRETAAAALEWARSLANKETLNDYEHSVLVVAGAEMIEVRSAGIAASIVGVHLRNVAAERLRPVRPDTSNSQHVGMVGERLENVRATVLVARQTEFSTVYTFLSDEGNVLTWFATKSVGVKEADKVVLKGTVVRHGDYKGTKQTVLNRCKVGVSV